MDYIYNARDCPKHFTHCLAWVMGILGKLCKSRIICLWGGQIVCYRKIRDGAALLFFLKHYVGDNAIDRILKNCVFNSFFQTIMDLLDIFRFQQLERLRLMIGFLQAFVVSLAGFYSCIFTLLTILGLNSEVCFVVHKKINKSSAIKYVSGGTPADFPCVSTGLRNRM